MAFYEDENEWLRNMHYLQDLAMPGHIICFGDLAKMPGLAIVYIGQPVNDNHPWVDRRRDFLNEMAMLNAQLTLFDGKPRG